jgi:acetyl-CoA synthetase
MSDELKKDDLTEVLLKEEKIYKASEEIISKANVKNYQEAVKMANENAEKFWEEAAGELEWFKKWKKVLDDSKKPFYTWFKGGRCNIFVNALERHQKPGQKEKIAILFESENGEKRQLTYEQLYNEVNKFASALKKFGMRKGDRLSVYLPNIPEVAVVMLACAKLGVLHSVVYAGFSYLALRNRINDAASKIVVTADGSYRRGKTVKLKEIVDQALQEECQSVEKVIVVKNTNVQIDLKENDIWYDDFVKEGMEVVATEVMKSDDPLFILYTSGTTGKPKGVVHTHGGYMVGINRTFRWVFDIKGNEIYWCTADPGWITGHSYIIYAPLIAGITTMQFEGVPDYPQNDRIWEMVERHKVNILYTAPTLIRLMMKYGEEGPNKHDMSSLRLLGSVGEPINPEAWRWYYKVIGQEKCPIMDTWWQTETGMFMICPLPVVNLKAGSATFPFPGIQAEVVDRQGKPVQEGKGGFLVIKNPWPAMLKTLYKNPKRYLETYWQKITGCYTTGDIARKDKDGYFWLQGRADDVLKISGHRIGTAEIESALVSHPAVAEVAVIGKPHPVKGEVAKAFLILKRGFSASNELVEELKQHIRKTMGPMAITDEIAFVDKLPKTRSGKIMRRVLKAQELGLPLGDISTLEE